MVNAAAYQRLMAEIEPYGATLVAVSKFKPAADIRRLYELGHRDFGENYVQELVEKYEQLPKDIRWHFIGHLQRNKVKQIAPFIHLIHSVDRFSLLKEINKQAAKCDRVIPCLLQMHVAREETKFGMDEKELVEFFSYYSAQKEQMANVSIDGIMGMATFTDKERQIKSEFEQLKNLFEFTRNSYFLGRPAFRVLSMGMTNDYPLALAAGSNMLRVGSLLFGKRTTP